MTLLIQIVLLLVVLSLELGPIGRAATEFAVPSFSILATWAFTWFGDLSKGLRWALMAGIVLDLISFLPFGTWLAVLGGGAYLTNFLKTRFFEVSSLVLALVTLGATSLFGGVVLGVVTRAFDLYLIGIATFINVLAGIVIYYVVALPFRFLQRWTGRRL